MPDPARHPNDAPSSLVSIDTFSRLLAPLVLETDKIKNFYLESVTTDILGPARVAKHFHASSSLDECLRCHGYELLGLEKTNPDILICPAHETGLDLPKLLAADLDFFTSLDSHNQAIWRKLAVKCVTCHKALQKRSYRAMAAFGEAIHEVVQQKLDQLGYVATVKGQKAIELTLDYSTLSFMQAHFTQDVLGLSGRMDVGLLSAVKLGATNRAEMWAAGEIKTIAGHNFKRGGKWPKKLAHYEKQVQEMIRATERHYGWLFVVNRGAGVLPIHNKVVFGVTDMAEFRVNSRHDIIKEHLIEVSRANAALKERKLVRPQVNIGPCFYCNYLAQCNYDRGILDKTEFGKLPIILRNQALYGEL